MFLDDMDGPHQLKGLEKKTCSEEKKKFSLKAVVWTSAQQFQATDMPYGFCKPILKQKLFPWNKSYIYVCVCVSLCPYKSYWLSFSGDLNWFDTGMLSSIEILIYTN